MNAQELRIGNWVNMSVSVNPPYPHKVNGETIDRFDWGGHEYSGIPITEEILLKLGFEKGEPATLEERTYIRFAHQLMYNRRETRIEYTMTEGAVHYCFFGEQFVPANFVHQLQNLYFALTGVELEIDLRNRSNG